MQISYVSEPMRGAQLRRIVGQAPDGSTETATIGIAQAAPPAAEPKAEPAAAPGEIGRVSQFIKAGTLVAGADRGMALLIQQANGATPAQFGGMLQQYHLVATPELAQSEGQRIAEMIQSKGGNSIMLGVRAGVLIYVLIDTVAPAWTFRAKGILSVIVAVAVAAALYFGIKDEAPNATAGQVQNGG